MDNREAQVDKQAYRQNVAGEPWNDPRHPNNLPLTLPRPFLNREDANERLKTLGFIIGPESLNYPVGHQKEQFIALQELMAAAIAEWSGLELEEQQSWASVNAELMEWTEEWLVG